MIAEVAFVAIIIITAILIIYGVVSFYTTKEVTIQPAYKMIDPGNKESGSFYLVQGKNGQWIELERPPFNYRDNIDTLYHNVDAHIANNATVTYECFAWDSQGWHWYYNCYKELNVN